MDARAALQKALSRWRDARAPRLAAQVEELGRRFALPAADPRQALGAKDPLAVEALLARVVEGTLEEKVPRAQALAALPPDPRIASAAASWLVTLEHSLSSSRPYWRAVFGLVEAHADPRTIERLVAARTRAEAVKGATMRTWLIGEIDRVAGLLTARFPTVPTADPLDLGDITPVTEAATSASDVDALLAAIRANPDDDAPRAVYADLLTQRGDPIGELITLQLADARGELNEKSRSRMRGLVRKHVRALLGELAPLVGISIIDAEGHGRVGFRRGFLAECSLSDSPKALRALAGRPELATVEHLDLPPRSKEALAMAAHPVMRALRRLSFSDVPDRLPDALASRIETLTLGDVDGALGVVLDDCAAMPRLRTLRVTSFGDEQPLLGLSALARLLGAGRIESLVLQVTGAILEVDRPQRRATITTRLAAQPVPDLVSCLAAVPIDTMVLVSERHLTGMAPHQREHIASIHAAALVRIEQAVATHLPHAKLEVQAKIGDP